MATPIRPTAKQILQDAKEPAADFIPARAGWNGPETQSASMVNPVLERFRPEAQREATRQALLAMAMPDWRIWTLLALIIIGLRLLVVRPEKSKLKPVLVEQPATEQPPSQLKAA
jgi:hypothetical protein